ncbi:MAG TPA: dihydroneopterin aldolase [Chitinophagaceae bacterium]
MAGVITVELTGLRFFAYHGVHKEEAVLGNDFEVEAFMEQAAPGEAITAIEDTINYVAVYHILKEVMQERQALLETCVMRMADRLYKEFPRIEKVRITLRKLNPPIEGFVGKVGVSYERRRD